MSNDDQREGFIEFMMSLDPTFLPNVIAALCPKFDVSATNTILTTLRAKGYQLFFWVIKHQYGGAKVVEEDEIDRLRGLGTVEEFSESAEADSRSKLFMRFVTDVVLA